MSSSLAASPSTAAAPLVGWPRVVGAAVGPLVAAALWLTPVSTSPPAHAALAIAVGTMVAWAAAPLAHAWTGVIALLLLLVSGAADATTIASGFWNNTTGFLFGALLVGASVSQSGLARRIALSIVSRIGSSYSRVLLALVTVDFVLTFVIPSGIARVAVLAAIVAGLVESMGLPRRDPVARGMMIAVTCSASIFDKMVLAGTSSILASGIIENLGGTRISYGRWFLAYVPCDILTIIGCWRLILWIFPDRHGWFARGGAAIRTQAESLAPMSARERRAAVLATIAVALWMTDVLHGLRPSTIALGIGLAAFLPALGVLRVDALRTVPYGTLVFTASALSISAVLDRTGALGLVTASMVGWMGAWVTGPSSAAFVLYWAAFGYHLLLGAQNLMVAATLPAVVSLGQSLGHSPVVIGMIWIFGTAGKIFPYQSGVLMVGYSFGYFDGRDLIKVGLLLAVLESAILFLLVPLYWPLIGLQ